MSYPEAPRLDLTEDIFGHQVSDPYRWMEDADSAERTDWLAAEADGGQRFIRHVEQQHSSHRTSRWRRLAEADAPSVSPGTRFCHHISVLGQRDRKVRP